MEGAFVLPMSSFARCKVTGWKHADVSVERTGC